MDEAVHKAICQPLGKHLSAFRGGDFGYLVDKPRYIKKAARHFQHTEPQGATNLHVGIPMMCDIARETTSA